MSSDGPDMDSEDDGSRSSNTSTVPDVLETFRRPLRQACHRSNLHPLEDVEIMRSGTSLDAMLFDGDCEDGDESAHFKIVMLVWHCHFSHGLLNLNLEPHLRR